MRLLQMNEIEIAVNFKKIKNMYLRVLPDGRVTMSAPRSVSDQALRTFAESKIPWMEQQRAKLQNRLAMREPVYETGESFELWGQSYPLEVIGFEGKSGARLEDGRILLQVRPDSTPRQRETVMNEWYRGQLKAAVPGLLERCRQRVGVSAREWNVKNMKTRWGTCNVRAARIWLSLRLARKPMQCLEYVITHELVHLLEPSHNRAFWGYMDQFYPGWHEVRALLKEH